MENKDITLNMRRVQQLRKWHVTSRISRLESVHDAQQHLLFYIVNHPGCTQKEIADFFALSKAAVTKSVKRMLKTDIVERHVNELDERKYALFATEKGQKLFESCLSTFDEVDSLTLKDFSEEDKEKFNEYLLKIMDNLETDYSRGLNMARLIAETSENK